MKKILILLICIMILNINVYANINYNLESNVTSVNGLTHLYERYYGEICDDYYLFKYEGKDYYVNRQVRSSPQLYNENEFKFFIINLGADGYIKTDTGYMVWKNPAPYKRIFAGYDSWKGWYQFYVYFYDNYFNLVNEKIWDNYITDCEYADGIYYCTQKSAQTGIFQYKTSDMVNWEKADYEYLDTVRSFEDIKYRSGKYNDVSFDGGSNFIEIIREDNKSNVYSSFSDLPYIVKINFDCLYLSKDNIYNITIPFDVTDQFEPPGSHITPLLTWYFSNDGLIIESIYENRIKVSWNEFGNELDRISNAPYIQLNNVILGFSEPPVMENDRTLVPMRFLFEQMGANVTWNESTETATATLPTSAEQRIRTFSNEAEKSVTFSIDNTNATVNGHPAEMDVPARLVNDKTMVPLRFLSENLGYNVEWDEATNTAIIITE